ncbi:MAG: hypothetical protein N3E36_01905 [Sulfolobales archaeon]|nr:hypothetical protein [Sulfolobales archaeon]MCX8198768.1 hypothetical protein [Sulfolobales archaeon]MDW8169841.1 hypothetical protein [Desulfurococcaceae archaeon]
MDHPKITGKLARIRDWFYKLARESLVEEIARQIIRDCYVRKHSST